MVPMSLIEKRSGGVVEWCTKEKTRNSILELSGAMILISSHMALLHYSNTPLLQRSVNGYWRDERILQRDAQPSPFRHIHVPTDYRKVFINDAILEQF